MAQPGFTLRSLQFGLFTSDGKKPVSNNRHFEAEWRNSYHQQNKWVKVTVLDGGFSTDKLRSDGPPTELKIYRRNGKDTMFITCARALQKIPFIPGHFQLDNSQCYLANMETMNGMVILNNDWELFRTERAAEKKLLMKKRFCYMSKSHSFFDEDEKDVQYVGFRKSDHLKEMDNEGLSEYIKLGKLYYAPMVSSSVYSIGFLAHDDDEDEKYSQFLMESKDGCRSWQIKFRLPENTIELVQFNESIIDVAISFPTNSRLSYSHTGKLLSSTVMTSHPCSWPGNMFYDCDRQVKNNLADPIGISDPFMDSGSFNHLFHTIFTGTNNQEQVKLESLPFSPASLSISHDAGLHWDTILQLHSKETYAYLTQRKNKLVLLSYHYTMVSPDFGKTWTFYANGTFTGGEWNFIWLDDRTLVNVTPYYADVMLIE